jgi:hypothetical protein
VKLQKTRLEPQVRNFSPLRSALHFGTAEIGRDIRPYPKILGSGKWATGDVGFEIVYIPTFEPANPLFRRF